MPYFPVGYPDLDTSIDVLEALAKHGADVLEVGLSFSDPLADGPIIQRATQTALDRGITTRKALTALAELRRRGVDIPLILMGYYNPMLAYGLPCFARDALAAGADGFIIPDLPAAEADEFHAALQGAGSEHTPLIQMIAPTTPQDRMTQLLEHASGFVYLVSVTGVTGARQELPTQLAELVARVRKATLLPVCVGFGISTPEQARAVSALADGVIVGSACVQAVGQSDDPVRTASEFAGGFWRALR